MPGKRCPGNGARETVPVLEWGETVPVLDWEGGLYFPMQKRAKTRPRTSSASNPPEIGRRASIAARSRDAVSSGRVQWVRLGSLSVVTAASIKSARASAIAAACRGSTAERAGKRCLSSIEGNGACPRLRETVPVLDWDSACPRLGGNGACPRLGGGTLLPDAEAGENSA